MVAEFRGPENLIGRAFPLDGLIASFIPAG
jgi:hypothetical protein